MKQINVALIGQWHVHGFDFAKKLQKIESCRLSAAADCPGEWAEELGCPLYPSVEEVLSDPSIDGIIVASSIGDHRRVLTEAAEAGKHMFVEKAFAASMEDAEVIADAVKKSGVHFTISDPVMKGPQMYAKNMMDSGKLGAVYSIYVRSTHDLGYLGKQHTGFYDPSENGGGALNDMGHKAVHILWNLMGASEDVSCTLRHITGPAKEKKAEDIAIAVYSYKNGCMGIVDCGWMTPRYGSELEILGTEGCVSVKDDLILYRLNGGDWETVDEEDIPEAKPYPLNYWVDNIREDRPDVYYGIDEALEVERMIMAAYKNAQKPDVQ